MISQGSNMGILNSIVDAVADSLSSAKDDKKQVSLTDTLKNLYSDLGIKSGTVQSDTESERRGAENFVNFLYNRSPVNTSAPKPAPKPMRVTPTNTFSGSEGNDLDIYNATVAPELSLNAEPTNEGIGSFLTSLSSNSNPEYRSNKDSSNIEDKDRKLDPSIEANNRMAQQTIDNIGTVEDDLARERAQAIKSGVGSLASSDLVADGFTPMTQEQQDRLLSTVMPSDNVDQPENNDLPSLGSAAMPQDIIDSLSVNGFDPLNETQLQSLSDSVGLVEENQEEQYKLPDIGKGATLQDVSDAVRVDGFNYSDDQARQLASAVTPQEEAVEQQQPLPSLGPGVTADEILDALGVDGFTGLNDEQLRNLSNVTNPQNGTVSDEAARERASAEALGLRDWADTQTYDNLAAQAENYMNMPANIAQVQDTVNEPGVGSVDEDALHERNLAQGIIDARYDNVDEIDRDATNAEYRDYFDSLGGLNDDYVSAADYNEPVAGQLLSALAGNSEIGDSDNPFNRMGNAMQTYLDNEMFDDGTMTEEARRAKWMDADTYRAYKAQGMGGRPDDEIIDGQYYNKLDEWRDYGFKPYIADDAQLAMWRTTQEADDITKLFNDFRQLRDMNTRVVADYNGQQIDRDEFYDAVLSKSEQWIGDNKEAFEPDNWLDPDDPNVDLSKHTPVADSYTIHFDDGSVESYMLNNKPTMYEFPNGGVVEFNQPTLYPYDEAGEGALILLLPTDAGVNNCMPIVFDNHEQYENDAEYSTIIVDPEDAIGFAPTTNFEYEQDDGSKISLTYAEYDDLMNQFSNGTADIDWGPFNIAKDQGDRKNFEQMFTTGDWSDFVPNFVDLATGSAPLFHPTTAWPMAFANAGTALQGIDPQVYNWRNNSFSRVASDITPEQYVTNVALSGLVPATERIAGGIGGTGGVIGKPIQNLLGRIGAPALSRYGLDALGEGVEEIVASTWEDAQTYGLQNAHANQIDSTNYKVIDNGDGTYDVVDLNGDIVYDSLDYEPKFIQGLLYDSTNHELRDWRTGMNERVSDIAQGAPENMIAGTILGGVMGMPRMASDYLTGSGYVNDARKYRDDTRMRRSLGIPKFHNKPMPYNEKPITQADHGTYGRKRK
jgi:hypothetical protein